MLVRVYARCVTGLEDVWIGRMDNALHLRADDAGGVLRAEPVIRWHDVSANVEPSAFPQVKTLLVLLKKAPQ